MPPGAADDPTAPFNEKTKVIEINISQCLSCTVEVVVPEDFDEYEASEDTLKDIVREQIVLPSELTLPGWYVDEFSVCL